MKKTRIGLFSLIIFCFSAIFALAQTSNIVKTNASQAEIDRIIKHFSANEFKFREALKVYDFINKINYLSQEQHQTAR